MFETIRKHSKIVMIFLFLLIIPAFVLVGTDRNYFSEASPVVARVDGHDISQADWDRAHRQESDRIRAQSPTVDARLLDSPLARYATLERLVRERVLDAAAQQMRLVTSDARLIRSLQETPAIAALKRADGTLDADAYRALLVGQGVTPEVFEANLRRNIAADQVLDAVLGTALVANAQARLALDALYERRDIQVARFDAPDFAGRVLPTDADLQSYYDAHPAQFRQPEQATVEYLVLDLDSVRATITVPEDELRSYYDSDYLPRIMAKQERRASHILISVAKDAPAAEREKAKARATELLAQLRKTPADFAQLAKQSSDDKGSAAAGGDLNYFPATATGLAAATEIARGQGQNLPRPVIDAALRTPADALPAWTGVDLGAAGYAVVKINRVLARQAPDAQRAQQEQQQYAQWLARAEVLAYYELLKQRLKVRIQAPRPQVAAPEIAEN